MNAVMEECITACFSCAIACEQCATECLKEEDVKMLSLCIRLDRECALVCQATASLMSMGGSHPHLLCGVCEEICLRCAEECERHSDMEHCKRCAEECRRCAEECSRMLQMAS
jgi:hypothetical protein